MGMCCAGKLEDGTKDDEEQGELEQLLRERDGVGDDAPMIQLHVRCRNLRAPQTRSAGLDKIPTIHAINPFVRATLLDGDKRTIIGQTEPKFRSTNPEFVKALTTTYQHETQEIQFDVYDTERRGGAEKNRCLGSATMKVLDLMSHDKGSEAFLELPVKRKDARYGTEKEEMFRAGQIIINAEETKVGPKYEVVMEVGCGNLDSVNLMGAVGAGGSDPYLVISRVINGVFTQVYKTNKFDGVTECDWKTIVVSLEKLCKSDFNQWLLFEVWDHENTGPDQLIGYTRQTLAFLLANLDKDIDLINDNARGSRRKGDKWWKPWEKQEYLRSGTLLVRQISIDISYSFLEYVKAGFDINVTVIVDFSSSNHGHLGIDGNSSDSLHYVDRDAKAAGRPMKNAYSEALESVVDILGTYDKDQEFPFYGLGAIVNRGGQAAPPPTEKKWTLFGGKEKKGDDTSNIFHVTMNSNEYTVHGIKGILDAYWDCWKHITPAVYRQGSGSKTAYQIALLLTDGHVSDMQDTIDIIVESSNEPISIIIIGVGDGDFALMEQLSADEQPLISSKKKPMKRDIVGFVPINKFPDRAEFTSWAKQYKVKPGDLHKGKEPVEEPAVKPKTNTVDTGTEMPSSLPQPAPVPVERKPAPPPLDNDGWESFSDDETGDVYFHNRLTKVTQWEAPPGYRSKSGRVAAKESAPSSHIADVPYMRLGAQKKVTVRGKALGAEQHSSIGSLVGLSGNVLSPASQPSRQPSRLSGSFSPISQHDARGGLQRFGSLNSDPFLPDPARRSGPGGGESQRRASYQPPQLSSSPRGAPRYLPQYR